MTENVAAELHMLSNAEDFGATEQFICERVAEAALTWGLLKDSKHVAAAAAQGLMNLAMTVPVRKPDPSAYQTGDPVSSNSGRPHYSSHTSEQNHGKS